MTKKSLTTTQVIIRIVAIVSLVEYLIMLGFGIFEFEFEKDLYVMAATDIVVLAALSTPLIFFLVVFPFVKARDEALKQLSHMATTDPLTQLSNRRNIDIQLEAFIASTVRYKYYGAVLLLDLDGFKQINDVHGHAAGDEVLVEIANRLRSRVRADEVAGRLGGDEFILLINNLSDQEHLSRKIASGIAEQLITLISQPIHFNDKKLSVGVSIGVRTFGANQTHAGSAIRDADVALYRAKEAGKGRAIVFED